MLKIADVKSKSRSKRKPLRDVSNGGFKPSTTYSVMKKSNPDTQQQDPVTTCGRGGCSDPLDRLLLVHSDLSVLIHQIDELVVQALKHKVRNNKDIESFANVLHEMQTSLKPWVTRFQKIISTRPDAQLEPSLTSNKIGPSVNKDTRRPLDSLDIDNHDFLVSPSPLVSWRADCAADGGKNLFMLTPLPKPTPFTSRLKKSSKSVFKKITSDSTVGPVAESIATTNLKSIMETGFNSPEKFVKRNDPIVVSTPYLKMSPPKSCILLEPLSECCNKKINSTNNPTMHHDVGGGSGSGDSEPASSQPSGHLALKYPEIFGIRTTHKRGNARKVVEASPNWCMSPPKTCVLLEPSDDQALSNFVMKDLETNLPRAGGIPSVVSRKIIDSTPMCKDLDTTILRGKRAGENTLKKELWTRFEAATAHGIRYQASVDQETANVCGNKGFMDLLEEVSCDDTNSLV